MTIITRWGRVALGALGVSFMCTAAVMAIEEIMAAPGPICIQSRLPTLVGGFKKWECVHAVP